MSVYRFFQVLPALAGVALLGAGCIRTTPVAPVPDYVPLPVPAKRAVQPAAAPPAAAPPVETPTAKPEAAPMQPLGFAPVAYFEEKCARCHGSYGSFYGSGFGKNLSDEALIRFVKEMAEGPAMAPLEPAQLAVETAYHRSMVDGRPFLAVTEWDEATATLRGETTPGATVEIKAGERQISAVVEEHRWSVALPDNAPGAAWSGMQIIARKGEAVTTLELSEQNFSHQEPVKQPVAQPEK